MKRRNFFIVVAGAMTNVVLPKPTRPLAPAAIEYPCDFSEFEPFIDDTKYTNGATPDMPVDMFITNNGVLDVEPRGKVFMRDIGRCEQKILAMAKELDDLGGSPDTLLLNDQGIYILNRAAAWSAYGISP